VSVTRARVLLDARQMVERLRELVPLGALVSLDTLPGLGAIGQIVSEAEIAGADRVENPAGLALDSRGDRAQKSPLTSRAAWTSAGLGSSGAKTAST